MPVIGLFKKLVRDDRGAAIVEAAVTFPMLITLGFGVFEFSNAFYDHQEVTTGVRDATRYLARVELTPANPTCDVAIPASAGAAQNIAVFGNAAGTGRARVKGWTTGMVTVTTITVANAIDPATGSSPYRGPDPICIVRVRVAVPYPQFGLLTYLGVAAPVMNVTHNERWIGG
jgi:Flp pilus assembly protein TadG